MSTPPTVPSGSNLYSQGFGSTPSGTLNTSIRATRAPSSTDIKGPSGNFPIGQRWIDQDSNSTYTLTSFSSAGGTTTANWVTDGGGSGALATLTGDTGGAISPSGGNITLAGTANQITTTGSGSTITSSIPATFVAPGSVAATTTVTATLGDITATDGNLVCSAAGAGLVLNSPTASASGTVVVNGRSGLATFTSVSIAAGATSTLTITNSAITGATTQVLYSLQGATAGAALSIVSVTNSAGSSAVVVTNGTGATTTTADINLVFLVLN